MNDDFIYKSLPKIRKEFAESLYSKISKDTSNVSKAVMYQKLRRRRLLQAAAIVLGVLILIAWSQLKFLVRYVPIGNLWLVEYNQTTQNSSDNLAAVPFVPTPLPSQIFDMTSMPTPESGDFILYYPSWIPEGYQPFARPNENTYTTLALWSNDAQQKIRLFIESIAGGMHPYAPAGTWKEVRVQGQPAILIYGRLALTSPENPTATRKWDNTLGLQLHWIIGEQVYGLETIGSYLSEEDLIRMAESMEEELPPWPRLNTHTPMVGTEVPVVYYFIPSLIPEGFQDIENLDEMMFVGSTLWIWTNDAGEQIRLSWQEKAGGMHPYAPQGMWKEVSINDQPAILIHGRLALTSPKNPTANREWDETLGLQLSWSVRDLLYTLETYGPYVSESDLIRMAESTTWIPYTP